MSFDTEHAVIGALLKDPVQLDEIDLLPEDFETEQYRIAYQCLLDMYSGSDVIDVITVAERLEQRHKDVHWLATLGRAMKDCVSTANAVTYADMVRKDSRIREGKAIAANLLNRIESDGFDAIDDSVRALMELANTRKSYDHSLKQILSGAVERIDDAFNNEGTIGIPTGLHDLDFILSGFHDTDLVVIAGRPAMGKTAVLLNLANNSNVPCGVISAEQPGEQLGLRLIANEGRISSHRIRTGKLTDEDWPRITSGVANLSNKEIWINDKPGISFAEVVRQARKWKHNNKIEALYLDYIQKIKWHDRKIAKWEQVGEVVGGLKNLARELEIPVVGLSQVNRECESRKDKRPLMSDLANSGEIEKEADVIMTLYRDEVYDQDTPDKGIMEINVMKNRHGPIGYKRVVWLEEYMRLENYSRDL